jgi:septal ring factor EnvC (AmiA/AmiB activator)
MSAGAAAAAAGGGTGARAAAGGAAVPPLPIAGPVAAAFGQEAPGPRNRGIVIRPAPGQPMAAPADGRVVFAGPFRSYGLLLIIDHEDGYHSLLSGMTRLRVGVNQWVRAGEPVGSFDELGETGPQLYVELRRNGRPVNPLPWLAASDSKVRG